MQARKRQSDFRTSRSSLRLLSDGTMRRVVFCVTSSARFRRFNEGFELNVHPAPSPRLGRARLVSYFLPLDLFSNCCMTSSQVATQNAFGLYLMCVGNQPIRDAGAKI